MLHISILNFKPKDKPIARHTGLIGSAMYGGFSAKVRHVWRRGIRPVWRTSYLKLFVLLL
jgi:hypothetical protein